jgi:microcystin-dependent protein
MDPFVGEIRLFALNFAPRNWAFCQGQVLSIAQNTALFSLLGTQYGGNGTTTFGLPDLRGRTYVGAGQGAGLSPYPLGTLLGSESVTLLSTQIPAHTHTLTGTVPVNSEEANSNIVAGGYYADIPTGTPEQYSPDVLANGQMAADIISGTTGVAGGGQGHENRMPFLVLNYCIALWGIYPQRP